MSERPKRRRSRVPVMLLLAALVAGGGGYGYWRYYGGGAADAAEEKQADKTPKTIPVTVESVRREDYPVHLNGLGTVEALNTVTVRAQISGQILQVVFREGQIVRQGDLLVEIDPRPLQAALDQANARLAQDEASLRDAQVILARLTKLAQQQITTRQELDTQTAAVNQLTAAVAGDRAAVENAQTQLSYASVRAPITGRAGFRLADVGNLVGPSDTTGIVTIQQVTPISVVFTAPENEIGSITAALGNGKPPVDALSSDGQRTLGKGSLRLIDNTVDAASGTVRMKAIFPNDDGALWPGQSVTTRLLVRTEEGATVVSETAVQHGPDGLFAYVVGQDNKAEMRPIEVAATENGTAMVGKGLKPGEAVIVDGQYRVEPDSVVDAKKKDEKTDGDKESGGKKGGEKEGGGTTDGERTEAVAAAPTANGARAVAQD